MSDHSSIKLFWRGVPVSNRRRWLLKLRRVCHRWLLKFFIFWAYVDKVCVRVRVGTCVARGEGERGREKKREGGGREGGEGRERGRREGGEREGGREKKREGGGREGVREEREREGGGRGRREGEREGEKERRSRGEWREGGGERDLIKYEVFPSFLFKSPVILNCYVI